MDRFDEGLHLWGASYSIYQRIVRMVMEEKGLSYHHHQVDIFDKENLPADFLERQPFSKIPAFAHDGFQLYETDAILHYLEDTFPEPRLMPSDPKRAARQRQVMRICDNTVYPVLIWKIYVPLKDEGSTHPIDLELLAQAKHILSVLEGFLEDRHFGGGSPSLADFHALACLDYLSRLNETAGLLSVHARLNIWLESMRQRPSAKATEFPD